MPFVNGVYKPLSDDQIGTAPVAQAAPSDQPQGVAPSIDDTSSIGGDIMAQYRAESGLQKLNPFRTVGNIYTTIVKHAVTPPDENSQNKSLLEKGVSDVAQLGAILPTILSHPVKTVEEAPKGLVESVKNIFDPNYYKEHPVLGVVNTLTTISGVAGIVRGATMRSVLNSAKDVAVEEASNQLGMASAKTAAEMVVKKYLPNATQEALRTGSFDIVKETLTNALQDRGFTPSQALAITEKTVAAVQDGVTANASRLGLLTRLEHPVDTAMSAVRGTAVVDEAMKAELISKGVSEAVATDMSTSYQGGLSKITQQVFGDAAKTAVGRLYGTDVVAQNPAGFLDIENWAGQQAIERGWKNTIDNRMKVMEDWQTSQGDWAFLSPEERVARQQNYIKATQMAQQVNAMTGDITVPTKFLSPQYVDAIVQTIKDAPKDQSPLAIWEELKRDYGNDVALHQKTIDNILSADPNSRQGLIEAIQSLGKRSTLSYHNLPKVNAIIKQMEDQTGYRLIEAPTKKKVSFAEGVGQKVELPQTDASIGATSFRGTPVSSVEETLSYYNTTRAKGFANFIKDIAKEFNVKVGNVGRAAGIWEGAVEPSFKTEVSGTLNDIFTYAASLGKKGNQDAVIVFEAGEGAGMKYKFNNVPNVNEAIKAMQEAGIQGATVDGHSVLLYDFDGTLADKVATFADTLGVAPEQTPGTVTLIERSQYGQYLTQSGSGARPVLSGAVDRSIGESPALTAAKSKLGKLLDRFGLSPDGGTGSLEAVYADEFAQNANKILGEKYGSTIKVGNKTLPLEKLYSYLDRNKNDIMNSGYGVTGIHYTVADLNVNNLTRLGVDEAIAKDIVQVARQSLADMPWSKTGLAEGMVNYMRAKSDLYNAFYKLKNHLHFNLSPSFAARKQFKNNVLASMRLGKVSIDFGERINNAIRQQVARIPYVKNVPYFDEILAPKVNLAEIKLLNDEVISTFSKDVFDYASNPEIAQIANDFFGQEGMSKVAKFSRSIQDRNVFNKFIGYNVQTHAAAFAKGLAEKYGMSLEDALGFHYQNGVKIYNNPTVANLIKDSAQSIFHYEPGVLTSPMMRTINTIWFPTRFETKVAMQTARWFSSLSPYSRVIVADSMIHFVNWKNTPEGKLWLKQHHNAIETTLDYLLPYKEIGQSLGSFASGRIFDGETGMIGGLPFGFFVNVLQDLGVAPEAPRTNPVTGKPTMKAVPKKLLSEATVVTPLEDLATFILPSVPIYTLTGGAVQPFGQTVQEYTKGIYSTGRSVLSPGSTSKQQLKKLNKQYKEVPSSYGRFFGK